MTVAFRFPWWAAGLLLLLASPLRTAWTDLQAQALLQQADEKQNQFLFDEALALQRRAVQTSPGDATLYMTLAESVRGLLFFREDPALQREADAAYSRAAALSPHWSTPHYEHARMYGARRQYAQALPLLDAALKLDPNNAGYWLERGRYLEALARRGEAAEAYRRCAELLPPQYDAECETGAQRTVGQP